MTVPPLRELVHTMLLTEQEADLIDDLRANKVVVVACPPGGRVVVSRESKPCPNAANGCEPDSFHDACEVCGGSGVVEATTIHAVEPGRGEMVWQSIGGAEAPRWAKTWRAVALPEETPQ